MNIRPGVAARPFAFVPSLSAALLSHVYVTEIEIDADVEEHKEFIDSHMPPFVIEFADSGNAEREKRRLGQKLKENAGELGMVDFRSSEDEEVGIIPSADAALHDKTYPTKPGRRPAGGRKLTDLPDGTDEAAAIGRSRKP